jgi:hypothetical protein
LPGGYAFQNPTEPSIPTEPSLPTELPTKPLIPTEPRTDVVQAPPNVAPVDQSSVTPTLTLEAVRLMKASELKAELRRRNVTGLSRLNKQQMCTTTAAAPVPEIQPPTLNNNQWLYLALLLERIGLN